MIGLLILAYFIIGFLIAYGYYTYLEVKVGYRHNFGWNKYMGDLTKSDWKVLQLFLLWGIMPAIIILKGLLWVEKWAIRELTAPKENMTGISK